MSRIRRCFLACLILVCAGAQPALAQVVPGWNTKQFSLERIDADRVRLMREVEIEGEPGSPNAGQKFFADDLDFNTRTGEMTARGNVVFSTPTSRISAESMVFNTHSKMGTFTMASGISQLGEKSKPNLAMFGGVLEPDVYFYGDLIEKIGPDKYRITRGGFTTCVQPTPRWQIVANHATVNLHDYVVMRNAVVTVKDVPVFYLPMLYYPIQDDDRATGLLMPLYGASTYRGQSLSNAFFWAVNRSQDVTLMHDWFFSRGIGMGSEYRYALSPQAQGNFKAYWLNEHEAEINGQLQPARKSSQMTGGLSQGLPFHLTARARVDYFSDVTVQQQYNNNFYDASRSTRSIGGGISGAWRALSVNANYQRTEQFTGENASLVTGAAPGITLAYSGQKLGFLPLYASVNAEATKFLYQDKRATGIADFGLAKVDFLPSLRAPISTLPYLTANATVAYRTTYFSESLDPITKRQIETPVSRNYADLRAEVIGPVFSRVFSPNNAIADRLKHVIEPSWSVQRRTKIDNQNLIPTTAGGGYDTIIGGSTQMTYGLANRIMVRKTGGAENDPTSAPREVLNVSLKQSYYTDERASQYDTSYSFGYLSRPASPYSPIALIARASPTLPTAVDLRLEYDPVAGATRRVLGFGLNGTMRWDVLDASAGWNRRAYSTPTANGATASNYLQSQANMRFSGGKVGGTALFNWDIERSVLLNQRYVAYYNAQCCGISFEYQAFNFPNTSNFPVPKDRRFNLSFTLAGVGSFSNFLGAFGVGTQ
ncbi:MAG: putative LPS assembly protein LptD [Vicinamibacterales bacterium]